MTDRQPRLFQIWLDASDGSIATYDGVQWPDGTADVHHRYRRPDGVQWTSEALAFQIHGKQARIEWASDAAATLAAVREFLELSDDDGVRTREHLLGLLDQASVPSVVAAELGESLRQAMDAMKPDAESVFCHHPDARRTVHETMQAGWGRCAVVRLECPTCQAWAQQLNDEPVLAPKLLNAGRCTDACSEQHTYRPGCQIAPDWGKRP